MVDAVPPPRAPCCCHNDLVVGNIIAAPEIRFLDWEYACDNDPFFDLGGNSLVGIAMVLAIEKELAVPIAPAVLFEHPTVAEFAAALESTDGVQQVLDSSSARGQRRRRGRSGNRK